MNKTQKQAELDRVLESCRSQRITAFLNWLARESISNPRHRAGWMDVYRGVNGIDSATILHAKDEQTVKNDASRSREYLDLFYDQEGVTAGIWIDLPTHLAQEERVGDKGGYGIRFRTDTRDPYLGKKRSTKRLNKLPLKPAASLWNEMLTSVQVHHRVLIFPADKKTKWDKNGNEYEDKRGLESGSGEVAAAFMIGSVTAQLNGAFEIKRSCDVGISELETPFICFVYLGSSINCVPLEALRNREPWRSLQSFYFFEKKTKNGDVGSVREGPFMRGKPKHVHSYKVVKLRHEEIDYALVSFFRNPISRQIIIAMQGISSIGTWAAAQFMTDDESIRMFRKWLKERHNVELEDALPSFELLLKVTLSDYRPVAIEICDSRVH